MLLTKQEYASMWQKLRKLYKLKDTDIVHELVDFCIRDLYKLDRKQIFVVDKNKLKKYKYGMR